VSPAKAARKAAAVEEPASRPAPTFFTSATSLRTAFRCPSQSGMGQARSAVASPALRSSSISRSLLPKSPVAQRPSATTQAPVRVARSMMARGAYSFFA